MPRLVKRGKGRGRPPIHGEKKRWSSKKCEKALQEFKRHSPCLRQRMPRCQAKSTAYKLRRPWRFRPALSVYRGSACFRDQARSRVSLECRLNPQGGHRRVHRYVTVNSFEPEEGPIQSRVRVGAGLAAREVARRCEMSRIRSRCVVCSRSEPPPPNSFAVPSTNQLERPSRVGCCQKYMSLRVSSSEATTKGRKLRKTGSHEAGEHVG